MPPGSARSLDVGHVVTPVSFWPATLRGAGVALTAGSARTVWHTASAALGLGALLTSITLNWMSLIDLGAPLGLILLVTAGYALLALALFVAAGHGGGRCLGTAPGC